MKIAAWIFGAIAFVAIAFYIQQTNVETQASFARDCVKMGGAPIFMSDKKIGCLMVPRSGSDE